MPGPLAGVRVIDLTTVVMGPYATQVLADYGADVIKVEPPAGDVMRKAGPMHNPDMGHFYLNVNRGKRSVVLDLKQPSARDALLRMCVGADVLVYNIRPQAMERLGLSYEAVCAVAPGIIYVGAYGFSQKGPYAARPAYDDLIQGMCAIPWLTRVAGAELPRYAPMVFADRMVGLQLSTAIASALVHKARTGEGQRVDVPMFEGLASVVLGEHMAGRMFDTTSQAMGYQRSLASDRRPYQTRDGWVCVMVYNDKHWRSFFQAIGQAEVFDTDARFQSQGERLRHIDYVYGFLGREIALRSTAEWLKLLEDADIPAAPMYSLDDLLGDTHLNATGFFRTQQHPSQGQIMTTAVPTEWSATPPDEPGHSPLLGEHTAEVLSDFGFTAEEITTLSRRR
jgi:crotonobetainyl-CoA:carnitine CoA-transferase CaiB-like acyl-CoA transferase